MDERPKPNRFRVWWIPQVPMPAFIVDYIDTYEEAERIAEILGDYDLFQYNHNVKPDYSNVGGVEYWDADDAEWYDYVEEDWE